MLLASNNWFPVAVGAVGTVAGAGQAVTTGAAAVTRGEGTTSAAAFETAGKKMAAAAAMVLNLVIASCWEWSRLLSAQVSFSSCYERASSHMQGVEPERRS